MSISLRILLAATLTATVAAPAHADMTVKFFRAMAANPAMNSHTDAFLQGLTEGVTWSASTARVINGTPLFCMPGNLALTNDTAKQLILNSPPDVDYVTPTLLRELRKAFPCRP